MKNKLLFLTKMSLKKKIKTKWFVIANAIFAVLIIGLINIDSIIKVFGGDFDEARQILIIDEVGSFSKFESNYQIYKKYAMDYDEDIEIVNYMGSYDDGVKEVEDDNKILLVISPDEENYIKAKLVSKEKIGTITNTLISTTLTAIRSEIVLDEYNITEEMYEEINKNVMIENITLSDDNQEDDMIISTAMQVITLPLFMLIMFLVQMIGAEVNEEKTTKSMEIIISNVSPKIHFMSKVISANVFVILQGLLLIIFVFIGIIIKLLTSGGNIVGALDGEMLDFVNSINVSGIMNTIGYMIPVMIIMMLLTFVAYSLLAGILASMTTNQEDFQQLQTPIVVVSLIGYYLSIMAGLFKGSIFIRVMSYIPFVSSMLAPSLYVMGEITLFDLLGSILLLILVIYLLIKYGLRIYKVGILNYSQTGLWKKMFKAVKEK